jgi:hypothetical protein
LLTAGALLVLADLALLGYTRTSAATQHLRTAERLIQPMDPRTTGPVCSEIRAAMAEASPVLPLLRLATVLPNDRARAWGTLPNVVEAGQEGCEVLSTLTGMMPPGGVGDANAGTGLLMAIRGHPAEVAAAVARLRAALELLSRADPAVLAAEPRFAGLARVVESVRSYQADLGMIADLAPDLPELANTLLGGDHPRRYLLLGQNNDEARATGGFIGTLGLLTVAEGRIAHSDVRSSYEWDNPYLPPTPAPGPLQQYMNFGAWYLRDANWWVDFPSTVDRLLWLWQREQGTADQVDGVVAVDRTALEMLLDAVGGVEVPELGGHVDGDSVGRVLDQLRRNPEALGSGDYQRVKTRVLSDLHRALVSKASQANRGSLIKLLATASRAAQQKHILLWFRETRLEEIAAARDWADRVEPGQGDFLGVVDTSLSYGKVTPYIVKQVSYTRQPDGASTLVLRYSNHYEPTRGAAWDPLIDGTWWDWRSAMFRREQGVWLGYVRVLAPEGSALLDAGGWDDQPSLTSEGPVAVFGAPILVHPGEQRTVSLTYANPAPSNAPLKRFKQPGVPSD